MQQAALDEPKGVKHPKLHFCLSRTKFAWL